MSTAPSSASDLRKLSATELIALGEDSLKSRLREQAIVAHQKHGPLRPEKLEAVLSDPECARYPTRLVFEFGGMASHQFAQPDVDCRSPGETGRVLYLRPVLKDHPDLVMLAVAYMLPLVNYGDIITDEHCLLYGAILLGLMEDEFYARICALADFVAAEVRYPQPVADGCAAYQPAS